MEKKPPALIRLGGTRAVKQPTPEELRIADLERQIAELARRLRAVERAVITTTEDFG